MKITDVRVERYRWPKEKPIANGKHVYTHNELNLLIIDTDAGVSGYGCSWAIEFAESMGKAIIGEDPLNHERLWQKIYVPKFIGRRGPAVRRFQLSILHFGTSRQRWRECRCTGC